MTWKEYTRKIVRLISLCKDRETGGRGECMHRRRRWNIQEKRKRMKMIGEGEKEKDEDAAVKKEIGR